MSRSFRTAANPLRRLASAASLAVAVVAASGGLLLAGAARASGDVTAAEPATLREKAELGARILVVAPQGSTLTVHETRGEWLHVSTRDGSMGWVAATLDGPVLHANERNAGRPPEATHLELAVPADLHAAPAAGSRIVGYAEGRRVVRVISRLLFWVQVQTPDGAQGWFDTMEIPTSSAEPSAFDAQVAAARPESGKARAATVRAAERAGREEREKTQRQEREAQSQRREQRAADRAADAAPAEAPAPTMPPASPASSTAEAREQGRQEAAARRQQLKAARETDVAARAAKTADGRSSEPAAAAPAPVKPQDEAASRTDAAATRAASAEARKQEIQRARQAEADARAAKAASAAAERARLRDAQAAQRAEKEQARKADGTAEAPVAEASKGVTPAAQSAAAAEARRAEQAKAREDAAEARKAEQAKARQDAAEARKAEAASKAAAKDAARQEAASPKAEREKPAAAVSEGTPSDDAARKVEHEKDAQDAAAERKAEADAKSAERKAEADAKAAERKADADRQSAERQAEASRKAAERKAEADRKIAERQAESDAKAAAKEADIARLEAEKAAELEAQRRRVPPQPVAIPPAVAVPPMKSKPPSERPGTGTLSPLLSESATARAAPPSTTAPPNSPASASPATVAGFQPFDDGKQLDRSVASLHSDTRALDLSTEGRQQPGSARQPYINDAAQPVATSVVSEIVARVNDEILTSSDFERHVQETVDDMKRGDAPRADAGDPDAVRRRILQRMIEQLLLIDYGRVTNVQFDKVYETAKQRFMKQAGIKDDLELLQLLNATGRSWEDFRRELLRESVPAVVLQRDVFKHVVVPEEDIESHYRLHQQEWADEGCVRLREIVLQPEARETTKDFDQRLEKVLGRLDAGEDFCKVARDASKAATAEDCGLLPQCFLRSQLDDKVAQVVFRMKPGDVEPVTTNWGYHVLRLEEARARRVRPIEEVRDQILERLRLERANDEVRRFLDRLRESAKVEVAPEYQKLLARPPSDADVRALGTAGGTGQ